MATRKQIHNAFVAAKKHVAIDKIILDWMDTNYKYEYICHALEHLGPEHRAGVVAAKALIEQRFSRGPGRHVDISLWLVEVAKIPTKDITFVNLQAYRHGWLDSVIKEFS
jgi:hypothetical protein